MFGGADRPKGNFPASVPPTPPTYGDSTRHAHQIKFDKVSEPATNAGLNMEDLFRCFCVHALQRGIIVSVDSLHKPRKHIFTNARGAKSIMRMSTRTTKKGATPQVISMLQAFGVRNFTNMRYVAPWARATLIYTKAIWPTAILSRSLLTCHHIIRSHPRCGLAWRRSKVLLAHEKTATKDFSHPGKLCDIRNVSGQSPTQPKL